MVNWNEVVAKGLRIGVALLRRLAIALWNGITLFAKLSWVGLVVTGRFVEKHSSTVHEWASTGRHAKGNINHNSSNMIRQFRNSIAPLDKIITVGGVTILLFKNPVLAIIFGVGCYVIFFHNAESLTATDTIMGWLDTGVSTIIGLILFVASLVTSNRWRKAQFGSDRNNGKK